MMQLPDVDIRPLLNVVRFIGFALALAAMLLSGEILIRAVALFLIVFWLFMEKRIVE